MYRKNLTWFGFRLTQKQAVQIFILSLIGIIISSFVLCGLIIPSLFSYILYDPYYYPSNYFLQMLISMSPYFVVLIIVLSLSIYSVVRCRKIAKYYSYNLENENKPQSQPQYCPNCGQIRVMGHKFCKNCGQSF
jgi:hypothetical protein